MPRRFLATRLSPSSAERARNALDLELDRPSEFSLNRPASTASAGVAPFCQVATGAKNIQPRGIFFQQRSRSLSHDYIPNLSLSWITEAVLIKVVIVWNDN